MKRRSIFILVVLFFSLCAFSDAYQTESYTFAQLKNYHASGAWSLVIEKSDDFIVVYPFSPYKNEVMFFSAESYFQLNNLAMSKDIFESILVDSNAGDNIKKKSTYRLGTILSMIGEHERALTLLYTIVENPFEDERDKDVLIHVARSLSSLQRLKELTVVIEHYIKRYGENTIPLEIEPLLGSLWLGMGVEAFEANRYNEALEYFARADLQKVEGQQNPNHFLKSGLYQASIHYIFDDNVGAINLLESRLQYDSLFVFEYVSFLAMLKGQMGDFESSEQYAKETLSIFEKSPEKYSDSTDFMFLQKSMYWYSVGLYIEQSFYEASQVLEALDTFKKEYFDASFVLSPEVILLYAQSVYSSGNVEKAIALFEDIQAYPEEEVKALFLSQEWKTGSELALQSENDYLKGLAYYYLKDWQQAHDSFMQVINQTSNSKADWATYYAGMALYYNGEYDGSLKILSNFLELYPYHTKAWDSYIVCAICALENRQTERALTYSIAATRIAKTVEQKQSASVFAAGLYIDESRYAEANNLLLEFSSSNDVRSIIPRMLLSQTYAKMGNITQADNELKKILVQFPDVDAAREAAYKRGELYYEDGDYLEAEKLFKDFRYNYPSGSYTDVALFFEAESRLNQDDINGAILLYTDLVNRYVKSSYRFASISRLVFLHKNLQEYGTALEKAHLAQTEYPSDFIASSLGRELEELTALADGANAEITKTEFEWERSGRNTTFAGRLIGYDLALLYLQNTGDKDKALSILESLHQELQNTGGEYELYADVLDSLARLERERKNCVEAGRYYLQEVNILSLLGDQQEESQRALYGALEAFDCAGMNADAEAVFIELEKNYEDSIWIERAKAILNME